MCMIIIIIVDKYFKVVKPGLFIIEEITSRNINEDLGIF